MPNRRRKQKKGGLLFKNTLTFAERAYYIIASGVQSGKKTMWYSVRELSPSLVAGMLEDGEEFGKAELRWEVDVFFHTATGELMPPIVTPFLVCHEGTLTSPTYSTSLIDMGCIADACDADFSAADLAPASRPKPINAYYDSGSTDHMYFLHSRWNITVPKGEEILESLKDPAVVSAGGVEPGYMLGFVARQNEQFGMEILSTLTVDYTVQQRRIRLPV
jgi:hypothetical protein